MFKEYREYQSFNLLKFTRDLYIYWENYLFGSTKCFEYVLSRTILFIWIFHNFLTTKFFFFWENETAEAQSRNSKFLKV